MRKLLVLQDADLIARELTRAGRAQGADHGPDSGSAGAFRAGAGARARFWSR